MFMIHFFVGGKSRMVLSRARRCNFLGWVPSGSTTRTTCIYRLGSFLGLFRRYRKVASLETRKGPYVEEVATIGIRDGSTLIIKVFEEHNLKAVEQALVTMPRSCQVQLLKIQQASVEKGDYKKHPVELGEALSHCWYFDTLDSDKSLEQFKACQIPYVPGIPEMKLLSSIHDVHVG
ncbi:hypothetical protein EDB19DRAFT_2029730 [Suillus lakei]|nr:hypothetical protein EDB19DRAFT_2029730 [Suillus lakei]